MTQDMREDHVGQHLALQPLRCDRGRALATEERCQPQALCPPIGLRASTVARNSGGSDFSDRPQHFADDVRLVGEASIHGIVRVGGEEPEPGRTFAAHDLDPLDH